MTPYQTLNIGLSVLNNVQTFSANRKLDGLLSAQADEARRTELRDHALDQILRFERLLGASKGAAIDYWNARLFLNWQNTNQISSAALPSIDEKERFINCEQLAKQRFSNARSDLSQQEIAQLDEGLAAMELIPLMLNYRAWLQVANGMAPKIPLIQSAVWNGGPGFALALVTAICSYFVLAPVLICIAFIFLGSNAAVVLPLAFILAPIAGYQTANFRKTRAAALNAIVSPYGGTFTSRAKAANVTQIINTFKSALRNARIDPQALTGEHGLDLIEQRRSAIMQLNDRYSMGLSAPAIY